MRTLRTIAEVRAAVAEARATRATAATVGLIPTMGGFHAGHLSLIDRARVECDLVVVSLFVNPTQFEDAGDLANYPRNEWHDAQMAAEHGVDVLFAPSAQELYPGGFSTTVSVAGIARVLEGEHRGHGHFDGVATVVSKLLNVVGPDVAYFGQKDAQQALVIRRLVADLNLPVRIAVCPTVREHDGLAMSSRNVRLSDEERGRAGALYRALCTVREALERDRQDSAAARQRGLEVLAQAGVAVEYLEVVSPATLAPLHPPVGELLAVVAGRVGHTRLIDNLAIHVPGAVSEEPATDREADDNAPQPVVAGAAENGSS
jgi:pantoate--beta-alanine ligase